MNLSENYKNRISILAGINESEENIREKNLDFLRANLNSIHNYITKEIFENAVNDLGIDTIINFVNQEDGSNFRLQGGIHEPGTKIFSPHDSKQDHESDVEYANRTNKIQHGIEQLKNRFVQYFIRRIVANIPDDKLFQSKEDVVNFIKSYGEAFIYGYVGKLTKKT